MNSADYFSKLDSIVLSEKFVEVVVPDTIEHHPVCKSEKSIQYYLNRYIKPFVSSQVYEKMYPSGSQPGAIYGLVKAHKSGYPLTPVVCMTNTPQHGLAQYLDSVIKPCIPTTFMLNSTKQFLSKLKPMELSNSVKLVSFDVESLFTSVPLAEVLDLACEYVYSSMSPSKPAFEQQHFKKLLLMATSGEFTF